MTGIAPTVHELTLWAKARLDELDSCVTVMEERMGSTTESTRLQAHLALLDARKWREGFRARARDLRRTVDSGAAQAKRDLDESWNEFEGAFGRWVTATGQDVAELTARTRAQFTAWDRLIAHYKTKLDTRSREAKSQIEIGLRVIEEAAAAETAKLAKLQSAGVVAYGAWTDALQHSRSAFEELLQSIRTHLNQVGS